MTTRTTKDPVLPRKQPKQARSRQLVADILEGAARVFDREGLHATTNRVAMETGVSVGSLYQYFPNKDSLLRALAERHVDGTADAVRCAIARNEHANSLTDFMRALIHAVIQEHRPHSHLRPLLRWVGANAPDLEERFEGCIRDAQLAISAQLLRHYPHAQEAAFRTRLTVAALDGLIHNAEAIELDEKFEKEALALSVSYLTHSL